MIPRLLRRDNQCQELTTTRAKGDSLWSNKYQEQPTTSANEAIRLKFNIGFSCFFFVV